MKITKLIKTHLAKIASLAVALVLTAHVFVPAANIVASDEEVKGFEINFSVDNPQVEVTLNGVVLDSEKPNPIKYFENDQTLSLTVKTPYNTVIKTLTVKDTFNEPQTLLDDAFPSDAAGIAAIWQATDQDYAITKKFDITYLINDLPEIDDRAISITTAPSGFTTSSLDTSYDHVTPTFTSATHGGTSYNTAIEGGSLKTNVFPTGTELSFKITPEEHYHNPTVKFNDVAITSTDGIYTVTLSETSNNLQISAAPITGHITATADHGTTSLNTTKDYLEGEEVSFTVTSNSSAYYVDTVTANGNTLTADDDEKYSFNIVAGENTVIVEYGAYGDINIATKDDEEDEDVKTNDSAAAEKVKDLLTTPSTDSETIDSIASLKAAITKAAAVTVSLSSKKVTISDADTKQFQKIAAAADGKYNIAGYFDIDLKLTINKKDGSSTTHNVEKLASNMTVHLDISKLNLPPSPIITLAPTTLFAVTPTRATPTPALLKQP